MYAVCVACCVLFICSLSFAVCRCVLLIVCRLSFVVCCLGLDDCRLLFVVFVFAGCCVLLVVCGVVRSSLVVACGSLFAMC